MVGGKQETIIGLRDDHASGPWWEKIRHEYNVVRWGDSEEPKEMVVAPCSAECLKEVIHQHTARCKKCRRLHNGALPEPPESLEPVGPAEPVEFVELTDGIETVRLLLPTLRARMDASLALASLYEQVINTLSSLERLDRQRTELEKQASEDRETLRKVLLEFDPQREEANGSRDSKGEGGGYPCQ